jgi:hypothetical protein
MKRSIVLTAAAVLVLASCGDEGSSSINQRDTEAPAATDAVAVDPTDVAVETTPPIETTPPTETEAPAETEPVATEAQDPADDGVLTVPDEFDTITAAVDAASPGDIVLISPGTYNEAVDVTTDEVTIRGTDRNEVILDGEFELDNGVRVLGASGVVVENLTARNYTGNGVFFTLSTGYRVSYVTAYRNGDYGIYAFDSVKGQIEHSYASGSPDAGFYIGQCYPCDALIDDVTSEYNGLGYSGTNSGGNLLIVNSVFNNNRAGIVPNSGSYELCYPERETTIIGNSVFSNNQPDTPAIDVAILAMGNGILAAGGIANRIERNLIYDHDKTGIALVPFLEEGANDDLPTEDEWELGCDEARELPLADEIPDGLLWESYDNVVVGNDVSDSRVADLGVAGVGVPTMDLRNCWSANTFTTSAPADLETLAPCDGQGSGSWDASPLDVLSWIADIDAAPPAVDYQEARSAAPAGGEGVRAREGAPAMPATDVPRTVDLEAIAVPAMGG